MSFFGKSLVVASAIVCIGCARESAPTAPAPQPRAGQSVAAERESPADRSPPKPQAHPAVMSGSVPAIRGATLREAIDRFLRTERARGVSAQHVVERIDLNGDSREDALVLMRSRRYCGSRGCLLLVFERTGSGYQLQSRLVLGRTPMIATEDRTAGWRDLVAPMTTAGAGMRLVVLQHRNGAYPADAEQLAAVSPSRQVSGRVLFSDD